MEILRGVGRREGVGGGWLGVENLQKEIFWGRLTVDSLCLESLISGFVQSLEFLKKSWNLPNNFPDLEKVLRFFFFFGKATKLCLISEICFVLFRSYSISPLCLQCTLKKLCSCVFLRSVLITYLITLSLEKEIIILEKKSG